MRKIPIGDEYPIFLAPMAGYTDISFRKIAFENELPYAVSEMISAKAMSYNDKRTLEISKTEGRCGIQLFGHELEAFRIAIEEHLNPRDDFLWIDLNFGCPAPKIFKNQDGSSLLQYPNKISDIIKTCKKYSNKPVSAKMRLGIGNSDNAIEIAKIIEDAEADFLTVHGRTRDMGYSGVADWVMIFKIRKSLSIPVIGNGDINSASCAVKLLQSNDIDGISIGRAAVGNPFIFKEIISILEGRDYKLDAKERYTTIKRHFKYLTKSKGERRAVNDFRKHLMKYLNEKEGAPLIRKSLGEINSIEDMDRAIDFLFDKD